MDELTQHCTREISFDGEFGCDVNRLHDFVVGYYAENSSNGPQCVDDKFNAFVWSIVVQQPNVRVGTIPPGDASEVYIAPQASAARKAKAIGGEVVTSSAPSLNVISDAAFRPLEELKRQYGDALRIAVDPEQSFVAITGSHVRSSKLSPMVYTALQLITRGRQTGISVVELGQKSGYDQKACFYLIKQLLALDLIVKVRRGGVGTHFCIHKYFYERSPEWKRIREEEDQAGGVIETEAKLGGEINSATPVDFQPMDALHLSSLPVVRARLVRLLKSSRNFLHPAINILPKIGFANPTKTDRRFFNTRVRELIQEGTIERLVVPHNDPNARSESVKCFHLITPETPLFDPAVVLDGGANFEDEDQSISVIATKEETARMKSNLTFHKQTINLLVEAGTTGMTLNEICASLSQFDRRTMELLLTRAEKFLPPRHLIDIGVVGVMETHGRERRHRYYSTAAYVTLMLQENLDPGKSGITLEDIDNAGGFEAIDPDEFCEDERRLKAFLDNFEKDRAAVTFKGKRKPKNPVLPDGTVKLGRPRKHPEGTRKQPKSRIGQLLEGKLKATGKRKRGQSEELESGTIDPEEHSRLPISEVGIAHEDATSLNAVLDPDHPVLATSKKSASQDTEVNEPVEPPVTRKRRGRPPKQRPPKSDTDVHMTADTSKIQATLEEAKPTPKKRGRRSARQILSSDEEAVDQEVDQERPTKRARVTRKSATSDGHMNTAEVLPEAPNQPEVAPDNQNCDSETVSEQRGAVTSNGAPDAPLSNDSGQKGAAPSFEQALDTLIPIDPAILRDGTPAELPRLGVESSLQTPSQSETRTKKPKRNKAEPRINVSRIRRDNELVLAVENLGGIANVHSRDLYDAHLALIEKMTANGEATSNPAGVRLDKRTLWSALDGLESQGRIKIIKSSSFSSTGSTRHIFAVYLPRITQEIVDEFLAKLREAPLAINNQVQFVKKLDAFMEYGPVPNLVSTQNEPPIQVTLLPHPENRTLEHFDHSKLFEIPLWEEVAGEVDIVSKQVEAEEALDAASRETVSPTPRKRKRNAGEKKEKSPKKAVTGTKKEKPKDKEKEKEKEKEKKPLKRYRFQWKLEHEELARDASTIIRARCRGQRLDWSALEQVFPPVTKNTVRQRVALMRAVPANEAYLNRLEDKWFELWTKHRGTEALPDDNPSSPSKFDLPKHIEFLRAQIDKNAIRVGFIAMQEHGTQIPDTIEKLLDEFEVTESVPTAPVMEFVWSSLVEDAREAKFLQHAFTTSMSEVPFRMDLPSNSVCLAESALKMALGTASEFYNTEDAFELLNNIGEETVLAATQNLLNRGVLSKLVRDPTKSAPGRTLKISETNQNALGGSMSRDIFSDAASLEELASQQEGWREWPLLATDGDLAALIQLVSDNETEFNVDTSHAQACRATLDWNSKKTDDDQIEIGIHLRFRKEKLAEEQEQNELEEVQITTDPSDPTEDEQILVEHHEAKNWEGAAACCRRISVGLVDCAACLKAEETAFLGTLSEEDCGRATSILTAVRCGGKDGISKKRLLELGSVMDLAIRMTITDPPLLYEAGYSTAAWIAAQYLSAWTIVCSEPPLTRVFPRRWIDIRGSKITDVWEAALRAVVGVVLFRPGISQMELRWRLRSVYDRPEVNEILRFLEGIGLLDMRPAAGGDSQSLDEERTVLQFIGDKHWYNV